MEDCLFDLQQRFPATSAGSCSSQVNLVSPMKIAGGVIDGLVKGPYLYFHLVNMTSIFPASHFVHNGQFGNHLPHFA
jgi:hypothetical protein